MPQNLNTPRKAPFFLRALNWLAERDRSYREAQKLRNMPSERLDDMGMTREDAENAFRKPSRDRAKTLSFRTRSS